MKIKFHSNDDLIFSTLELVPLFKIFLGKFVSVRAKNVLENIKKCL